MLDDLNNLFKGNGKAIGAQRLVYKYGQVYHNNTWVNYYETYQREDYWAHDQVSYNSNGSVKSAEYKRYWPESYWPFQWIRTGDFSNDSGIAEVALYRYSVDPNPTSPTRDFYRYEGGLENWVTPGSLPY
ncbi:hypothetical protein [Paenibacillus sophorae]|uniref:hypothetical protein n=1 Tax=Paenibacillus sophorae TaxID=1333845 RepID=UPI00111428C1|nr:hypothetical protein [Paenibacillus sophorae]